MARLPQPGGDNDHWGDILNEYLSQSLTSDGKVKVGAVTKVDIGLGNVDNSSDANKPVSIATQAALDGKVSGSMATLDARYLGSGAANNPVTNATAVRPTGFTVVYWQCATQPTNWQPGDIWLKV